MKAILFVVFVYAHGGTHSQQTEFPTMGGCHEAAQILRQQTTVGSYAIRTLAYCVEKK